MTATNRYATAGRQGPPGPVGPKGPAGGLTCYGNFLSPPTLTQVGSSAVWTLAVAFTPSAMVFRNGLLLAPTQDYTTSGNSITFVVAPSPSDNLTVME